MTDKTQLEAIAEYLANEISIEDLVTCSVDDYARDLLDLCQPKWIDVDERLPKVTRPPYKRYLVERANKIDSSILWIDIQYYVSSFINGKLHGKWDTDGVRRWMTLPGESE